MKKKVKKKKVEGEIFNIYSIKVDGVVRYIGFTNSIKKRTYQHNYDFRKEKPKMFYSKIREVHDEYNFTLEVIKSFENKFEALLYEAFLILTDYFSDKSLWNDPPRHVKYY